MSEGDRSTEYIQRYIEFVVKMWQKYKKMGDIITDDGEVTPAKVNTAMALFPRASMVMHSEYRRQKIQFRELEIRFKLWEAEKMKEAKQIVFEEYKSNRGIKPSVKEFESQMRISYADEWYHWSMRIAEADERISFFRQMRSDLNSIMDILRTLSNNMRSEMKYLHLDETMMDEINPYQRPPSEAQSQRVPLS